MPSQQYSHAQEDYEEDHILCSTGILRFNKLFSRHATIGTYFHLSQSNKTKILSVQFQIILLLPYDYQRKAKTPFTYME